MEILPLCLQVFPAILFFGGLLGLMGIAPVGPRELPKEHPSNRRLAAFVVLMGLGLFLFLYPSSVVSTIGVVLALGGLIAYALVVRQIRRDFPHMTGEEWIRRYRSRFKVVRQEKEEPTKDHNRADKGE